MPCASQCPISHSWPSRLPSTYCWARLRPCLPTIYDSLVPCSRLIFAVVLPVVPGPAECASSTILFLPALANNKTVTRQVLPAPTTATSAWRSVSSIGLGG